VNQTVKHLAIVAGGLGTRMSAHSGLPKALIPVGGKPVLQHQIELARTCGFEAVTIFAGHRCEDIRDFIGDGRQFGLQVTVSVEAVPMGNAGAVVENLDRLPATFAVAYGDVMMSVDLAAMARRHTEAGADFTALAHPNDHPYDSDLLEADAEGWVSAVRTYPHPAERYFGNLVNAALYIVENSSLRPWRGRGKVDFTKDIMPSLVAKGARVLAYRSTEYIKDMGTPERLQRVERDLAAGRIPAVPGNAAPAPAVFVDRDGTLNQDPGFLAKADGLRLLPNVGEAVRSLRQGGYRVVVLTNQPVIARGEASFEDVEQIHRKLEWELGKAGAFVDGIYYCPHHPDRGFAGERAELKFDCDCRKPRTGMVEAACADLGLDRGKSWMIGDQTADIELAHRAGLRSVLVQTGAAGQDGKYPASADYIAADLRDAADLILGMPA